MRDRLLPLLERGMSRARSLGRSVLVSSVEPVKTTDPLHALTRAGSPQMYWGVPRDGFQLAAIGAVVTLSSTGDYRFTDVARAWERLRGDAVAQHDDALVKGAGPVLLGGYSFDPAGPGTELWTGFASASFVVPALTVACGGAGCQLTLNALIEEESDLAEVAAELAGLRREVLERLSRPHENGRRIGAAESGAVAIEVDEDADRAWMRSVDHAVGAIGAGAMEKVVLARGVRARVAAPGDFDARRALAHLRETQPAAFVFGIWRDDAVFLGATPERLACVARDDVETSVLAGSAPRGATPRDDARRIAELRASAKDREEHEIVRRDIHARLEGVCEGVTSPAEPSLVTLPSVHHLHTAVRGRLRAGHSVFDVIERLHPTPALGGAPREAALRFLREHEQLDRGWYAAPVGWVGGDAAEFAVALRSALVRAADAMLFAGCGVVAGSDANAEFAESTVKLQTAIGALRAGSSGPST